MARPEIALGPTTKTVSDNVKRLRLARGWTIPELSDALEKIGRRIPPLGLRKIEAHERRVDVDELLALARVLWVDPVTMLLPEFVSKASFVETSGGQFFGEDLVTWMRGVPREVVAWLRLNPGVAADAAQAPEYVRFWWRNRTVIEGEEAIPAPTWPAPTQD